MIKVCHGTTEANNCTHLSMYDYFNNKINTLESELVDWKNRYYELKQQKDRELFDLGFDRNIWIDDGMVHWTFYHMNPHSQRIEDLWTTTSLSLPISQYEEISSNYQGEYYKNVRTADGDVFTSYQFDPFVLGSFSGQLSDIDADPRGIAKDIGKHKDELIIRNAIYASSQLLSYSKDIGQKARFAEETLTRGGGDCEDMAILIADFLTSLESTRDWEINFVLMDTDNPTNPKKANHVILHVDTGTFRTFIEPTTTVSNTDDLPYAADQAMDHWNGKGVSGWYEEVTRKG